MRRGPLLRALVRSLRTSNDDRAACCGDGAASLGPRPSRPRGLLPSRRLRARLRLSGLGRRCARPRRPAAAHVAPPLHARRSRDACTWRCGAGGPETEPQPRSCDMQLAYRGAGGYQHLRHLDGWLHRVGARVLANELRGDCLQDRHPTERLPVGLHPPRLCHVARCHALPYYVGQHRGFRCVDRAAVAAFPHPAGGRGDGGLPLALWCWRWRARHGRVLDTAGCAIPPTLVAAR
mmetsp:Transcript_58570/g.163365  ORF Transcript_58570/g.163365 Transcript_58570/m.163365 type:complete len:235 (+) Transcript_58570:1542-2246(+)